MDRKTAEEIFGEIICPMCYRLNPHHASENNGKGCDSCKDKEYWCS
uniref:Uncharacterized protein n=1 Tax=viral metagenome TaxID=1070528 RepID=A0A6M3IFB3_9ZZZZ